MSGSRRSAAVPVVLRPVVAASSRLRTSARLAVLVLVLLVPGVGATWAYSSAVGGQIAFSTAEESGVRVLRPVLAAAADAVAGRTVDVAAIERAAAGEPGLDLATQLDAVRTAAGAAGATDPQGRAAVVGSLADLVTQVGNTSNLILDPDLDSFYVMDALVVQVPKVLVAAAAAAAPGEAAGGDDLVAAQAVRAGTVSGAAAALRGDVTTATEQTKDPALADRLAGLVALADAADAYAGTVTGALTKTSGFDPAPAADAAAAAVGPAADGLQALLGTRIDGFAADRTRTLALTAAGLLAAAWFAAGVWWRTSSDVDRALAAVTALAEGDRTEHPLPAGRDELGDLGRAVATTRQRLAEQSDELAAAQTAREEELRHRMESQSAAERQVRDRAQDIIDETATSVSEELRSVVEQVSAVRAAAATIDRSVSSTDVVTREVVRRADLAQQVVGDLGDSLREVGRMADLIAGVADQTRLLALNATIEAARAGSAGRGFSVVANEVKELAATTGRSTVEITATVGRLREQAEGMAHAIREMGQGIGSVDEATAVLSSVAADQHHVVGMLDTTISAAIERVESMSSLTDRLERRRQRRVRVEGEVTLVHRGRDVTVRLLDLAEGGVRCYIAPPERLDHGDRVVFEGSLDGRRLRLDATVAHRTPVGDADEVGLQFVGAPAEVTAHLRAAVERLSGAGAVVVA
ncbi:methyl-accepting chemotaxis protein [Kineosporia sp. R_H_3]|uniref:methyl-accepting chemotaxis protein n=1 Tax=Kineosporia sp. R_H_3 TaxID=1961848 RepID=UPI000B4A8332|nr:methyl-accepting chemotaxis protein [Kineosporia sp. R_H_3]